MSDDIMKEAEDIVDNAAENLEQETLNDESSESAAANESAEKKEVVVEKNVDYKDSLARLQAEFTNFKTRSQKEQERARNWGKQDAILALLPVMDEIFRARDHGELEADSPFGKIAQKFEAGLNKLGITSFANAGEEFDPQKHEALMNRDANENDNIDDGQVLVDNVIEHGYELNGEMFRTAKVSTVTK